MDDQMKNPEDGSKNSTVPLLLNRAYVRAKSSASDELRKFRISLKCCALDHSSSAGRAVSYTAFAVLAVAVPAATSLSVRAPSSAGPVSFNKIFQLPESALAAIAFLTLSALFRRHGLRQLLLLDGLPDDSACVRRGYKRELDRAFRNLAYILLPSFSVELAHKIVFFSTVSVEIPHAKELTGIPNNPIAFAATLASWVYRSGVFLLVCVLFRLTCELQILRFEGFYKMFEGSDAHAIFKEHLRIKGQLLIMSHSYRIFLISCLVTITASQLSMLMLVLASKSEKNFCNSGDLLVCSVVQLSGFFMCLIGAARITHRAQRVVSIASRWQMMILCSTDSTAMIDELDASDRRCTDPNLYEPSILLPSSQETSDSESRKALVMYLQHNGGGITLYGFALDRGLLHTLFAFELTLVLWILSKFIVVS